MKLTLLYDNTAWDTRLTPDWGFACLVEAHGKTILFDTGAKGDLLLKNMAAMGVSPKAIDAIVISHDHWDHTGGLADMLKAAPSAAVYVPAAFKPVPGVQAIPVDKATELFPGIRSTGTLGAVEQSLVVTRPDGSVVVAAGCSHPGVDTILAAARRIGPIRALVGGLHGFNNFEALKEVHTICPTHCTRFISAIKSLYPGAYVDGGAGRVMTF